MDSSVFKSFKSKTKHPNEEQIRLAENKYISSVYFHSLFLYTITKNRGYQMSKTLENNPNPVDLGEYLKDIFDHFYSTFILNFGGMEEMMTGVGRKISDRNSLKSQLFRKNPFDYKSFYQSTTN